MKLKASDRVTDKVCTRNGSRKSKLGRKIKRKETVCSKDTQQISWIKQMLICESRKNSKLRRKYSCNLRIWQSIKSYI